MYSSRIAFAGQEEGDRPESSGGQMDETSGCGTDLTFQNV
jgi:hypothetical protein